MSATRTPMEAFEVPGMVTVRGAQEIAEEMPASLSDVLDDIPGVTSFGGPRRTGEVPSIRGFSGPDVILKIDGARQNFVSGHDGRIFIDPSFLGGAEVVRGSSSALHGSGGTGGIVTLRTLRAGDLLREGETAGVRVGTSYRTGNEEFGQRALVFGRPAEGVDLLGGLALRQSDDIRLGNGVEIDARDDIVSGLLKGEAALQGGHGLSASWARFTNDAREPGNGQVATGTLNDKRVESDTFTAAYTLAPAGNPLVDLSAVAYYTRNAVDEDELVVAGAINRRKLDTLGLDVSNTSRFMLGDAAALALTVGGELYRDEGEGSTNGGPRGGVVDGEQTFVGAFVQGQVSVFDPFGLDGAVLTLTPGVRFDSFRSSDSTGSSTRNSHVSPKLSATFAPVPWGFVFASYADAFRAPRLDELFPTGTHFPVFGPGGLSGFNSFIPNTALAPQTTTTWEAGAGVEFKDVLTRGDILQAKAGYYHIEGKNFFSTEVNQSANLANPQFFPGPLAPGFTCLAFVSIATNPAGCGGTTQIVNVPDAEIRGAEIEAVYDTPRWRARLGGSTMSTQNRATGEPIGVEQPAMLVADLRLKLPEADAFVGWNGVFAAEFDSGSDATRHRGSYQVHGLYGRWSPQDGLLEGLSLGVAVENLFDEEYQRVASDTVEEGRSLLIDLSYTIRW